MHAEASRPWPGVAVRPEPYGDEGPQWVVAQAEAELVSRYGGLDAGELGLSAAMFDPPAGAFLVARSVGTAQPVGGVGVRAVAEGTGEVRRLWVDPAWRGRGVGRTLMDGLESEALDLGFRALCLATGDRQPEAEALYEATGWERVGIDDDGQPLPSWHIRFVKLLALPTPPAARSGAGPARPSSPAPD